MKPAATRENRGPSIPRRLIVPALLALACALAHAGDRRTPVVFITIDTLRADHLGCYGYKRETSPNIDRLAGEGVLFEHVATTMSTTLPAHTSLMSSSYTFRHGVRSNLDLYHQPVVTNRKFRMAAQMFARAGYRTAGFVSSTVLGPDTGIDIGFETYDAPPLDRRRGIETTLIAIEWLKQQKDGGFFLWLHLFDPHDPYSPPPFYRKLFEIDAYLESALRERGVAERHLPLALQASNLYDGEIRFADHETGRLLDALRDQSFYDASLVVLTADHGEGLLQHDQIRHGPIFNEDLDIPLIIKFPKGRGPAPRRIDRLVSLIDVLPLITDELDLPFDRGQFDGVNPLRTKRTSLLAERERSVDRYGTGHNFVLRNDQWKYFYFSDSGDALYDLENDYRELNNVIDQHPGLAKSMRDELLRMVHEHQQRGSSLKVRRDLSPELIEQLKSLGYVD